MQCLFSHPQRGLLGKTPVMAQKESRGYQMVNPLCFAKGIFLWLGCECACKPAQLKLTEKQLIDFFIWLWARVCNHVMCDVSYINYRAFSPKSEPTRVCCVCCSPSADELKLALCTFAGLSLILRFCASSQTFKRKELFEQSDKKTL